MKILQIGEKTAKLLSAIVITFVIFLVTMGIAAESGRRFDTRSTGGKCVQRNLARLGPRAGCL